MVEMGTVRIYNSQIHPHTQFKKLRISHTHTQSILGKATSRVGHE